MCNKNKYLLTVCLCISILSGCNSTSSLQSNSLKNNLEQCKKIDPVNTSLLTSGITGLITLNPIAALVIGGATYYTVDTGTFDCPKSES